MAQAKLNSLLFDAVIRGDSEHVSMRLSQGADPKLFANPRVHALDPTRFSQKAPLNALMIAAQGGCADIVSLLIPASDPSAVDGEGRTALLLAAFHGRPDCVALLIPVSDPSWTDCDGRDSLMLSCMARCSSPNAAAACISLLAPLCDFTRMDRRGKTALEIAAASRHVGAVDALLSASDLAGCRDRCSAALFSALLSRSPRTQAPSLIPLSDPSFRDAQGRDALFLAAAAGLFGPALDALLASPGPRSYMPSRTPLMAAAAKGALPTVEQLALAIDPRLVDSHGCDALMLAVEHGQQSAALALIPLSDLGQRDIFGLGARDKALAKPAEWREPVLAAIDAILAIAEERQALSDLLPEAPKGRSRSNRM